MRRNLVVLAMVMALVGAACAGASSADAPSTGETRVTAGSSTSTSPSTTGDETPPTTDEVPAARPEGPLAPDFTLDLGADGAETFVLSEEAKPVYMIFWAEW